MFLNRLLFQMHDLKLKQFEGPMDLLLTLIEEQKLDITQIALAQVTEQFLQCGVQAHCVHSRMGANPLRF